jgi:hypothetical protein
MGEIRMSDVYETSPLQPCPFCGQSVEYGAAGVANGGVWMASCSCGVEMWAHNETQLIAAWNRRAWESFDWRSVVSRAHSLATTVARLQSTDGDRDALLDIETLTWSALHGRGEFEQATPSYAAGGPDGTANSMEQPVGWQARLSPDHVWVNSIFAGEYDARLWLRQRDRGDTGEVRPLFLRSTPSSKAADTQRLDWLEKTLHGPEGDWGIDFFGARVGGKPAGVAVRVRSSALVNAEGDTLRDALDAGMEADGVRTVPDNAAPVTQPSTESAGAA